MNGKKRLSITVVILVPVFILGVLAIFSNITAISNLKRVNMTAVTIFHSSATLRRNCRRSTRRRSHISSRRILTH